MLNAMSAAICEVCDAPPPTSATYCAASDNVVPDATDDVQQQNETSFSNFNFDDFTFDDCDDFDTEITDNSTDVSCFPVAFASENVNLDSEVDDYTRQQSMAALRRLGHERFRKLQYPVIQSLIQGKNTLLILPTGGGKSLCFQIPILVLNKAVNDVQLQSQVAVDLKAGIGIVISPLISLMNDQVSKLKSTGIDAEFINSSLKKSERDSIERRLEDGQIEMLYCAPELFTSKSSDTIIEIIRENRVVSLFVIDEAHCISEWGHNFRPSYTKLTRVINALHKPTVMTCTATATQHVRDDILTQLSMQPSDCAVHIASFDRPNIYLKAVDLEESRDANEAILHEIRLFHAERGHAKDAVIVYCGSKKQTDSTAEFLERELEECGVGAYHAGMTISARKEVQAAFMSGETTVITATNAFGMGIDKANVGLVIHKTATASIEEFYQQIGRSGRNGEDSKAVVLYGHPPGKFIGKFSEFIVQSENPSQRVIRRFAEVVCRKFTIGEKQVCRFGEILRETGFSFWDWVTSSTVSVVLNTLQQYEVLKRVKSEVLPLKITFAEEVEESRLRQDTLNWRLWNEIAHRSRDGDNAISVLILDLTQRLQISQKELTKALQYLKNKKLLTYESLRRPGAIILLSDEFEDKVDWDEVELSRQKALENEKKMKRLIETNSCRRKLLLQHFDQRYKAKSNHRCCDNCQPYIG